MCVCVYTYIIDSHSFVMVSERKPISLPDDKL